MACNYAKGLEQMWGVTWTYTPAWHILAKVWNQNRDVWDTHTGLHRGICVCTQLFIGDGVDVGSQVDIHTGTDACTHSN